MTKRTKADHIRMMEVSTSYQIDCGLCYNSDEIYEIDNEKEAIKEFYNRGWRYGTAKYLAAEGILCPECWKKRNAGAKAWED